jgi:ABC-2 type transport system permease protein
MAKRDLRNLLRQPWFVAITLVQPIIWLLLFGQLFRRIVDIPGFGATNYIAYLMPGVVVMNALFSGGWSGMSAVDDLDRGVMDRLLVSPVSRAAIIIGRMIQTSFVTVVQATILIVLGYILGASYSNPRSGIPVLYLTAVFLAVTFAALSNGLGLLARQEETVIGATQFILLPLTFLSPVFIASVLIPAWMNDISTYNPLSWAVFSSREALGPKTDWGFVLWHLGFLSVLTVLAIWLATMAFRAYQNSI